MKLFSWGANSYGQLGQGIASNQVNTPTQIRLYDPDLNLEDVASIIGGGGHTFLLTKSGKLHGCGWNNVNQLGTGAVEYHSLVPFHSSEDLEFAHLSSKWDSSYGITKRNRLVGWGSNSFGQLGLPRNMLMKVERPLELVPESCVGVEAGLRHCAALTEDGVVLTAGYSRKGQLGRPILQGDDSFKPVVGLSRVRAIACGQHHTLVLTQTNRLFGWGCNKRGQLGVDPTLHQTVLAPLEIPLSEDFIDNQTQLYAGWTHSALLTGSGTIINWGWNKYCQLGSSSFYRRVEWKPEPIRDFNKVKNLYVGSEHNLAVLDDGVLVAWGWNEHGSCGVGHCLDISVPTCVDLTKKAVMAGVGSGHSFALTRD